MNDFIRSALIVTLGLGMNLLCTDAWADAEDPGPPQAHSRAAADLEALVEPIWSPP